MTPAVRSLLIANVALFFLQQTMPGITDLFVFVPSLVLVRPWSVVTYMFLHGGLWHLFGNMIGLFFFGPRVEERIGTRRFWNLWFISGIAGAILSFFFSRTHPIVGASGGVFGVTLAFAYFWPDTPIYIWGVVPVPAKLLVLGYGLYSLFAVRTGMESGTAHFAHLGGYAGAFLYLKWLERATTAFRRRATAPAAKPDRALASKYQSIDRSRIHEINREEVDRILDKINATGMGSLTPQERAFLSNFVPPDDRVPPVQ